MASRGQNRDLRVAGLYPEAQSFQMRPQTSSYMAWRPGIITTNAEFNRDDESFNVVVFQYWMLFDKMFDLMNILNPWHIVLIQRLGYEKKCSLNLRLM